MDEDKTFNCVVIAPEGLLLDCRTTSVIFPAHDGQVGVWYNHMPMFCKLGLGIMVVRSASSVVRSTQYASRTTDDDIFLLVDGGFAFVCSNLLKVTSYDVVLPEKDKPSFLEQTIAAIRKKLDATTDKNQHQHLARKVSFLMRLQEQI